MYQDLRRCENIRKLSKFHEKQVKQAIKEIFKMYNISDFVAEDAHQVYDILDKYLNGDIKFIPDAATVVSNVDEHFDKIFELINKKYNTEYDAEDFFEPLIELLPQNLPSCLVNLL